MRTRGAMMTWLELKIPPPVVTLIVGALMWFVANSSGASIGVSRSVRVAIVIALVAIGVAVGLAGIAGFRRAATTLNPTRPSTASALVTDGVFRVTRNPMYLGLLSCLLAWAVYLSSWQALLCVPLFVLYLDCFQIRPEERALSARFGTDYDTYKAAVRRWL